jgi:hypothetical protein
MLRDVQGRLGAAGILYSLPMTPEELISLWEQHIAHEFQTRDTEATLATMVEDS